jgi:hypothetical protein
MIHEMTDGLVLNLSVAESAERLQHVGEVDAPYSVTPIRCPMPAGYPLLTASSRRRGRKCVRAQP